ncbi:hypothetical protein [uncultured Roseobacter sp.]|uniref:hypothetical protein n=1 Tax=uncultured Roseobacter sp. TaxID=114847 RepID=UPI002625D679|nr:hypothetical protein [uncultured Roseobacter sp.]
MIANQAHKGRARTSTGLPSFDLRVVIRKVHEEIKKALRCCTFIVWQDRFERVEPQELIVEHELRVMWARG